jgi:CO/xanthine dehydrogenase Mo-binding subunit
MAAEELGLPIEKVDLIEGDTALTPDQGRTGGSSGLTQGGVGVRQAAATAREQLVALGAEKLKQPASGLVLAGGQVRPAMSGNGVAVGELIGGKRFALKVNPKVTLKDPKLWGRHSCGPIFRASAPRRRPMFTISDCRECCMGA